MKMMKRTISLILALLFAFAPMALAAKMSSKTINKVLDSIVRIYVEHTIVENESGRIIESFSAIGSGFAIGKKGKPVSRFVTNKHVVEFDWNVIGGPTYGIACNTKVYVVYDNINDRQQAADIQVSADRDLACVIIGSPTERRKPVQIALFDNLPKLTEVYSFGLPGNVNKMKGDGADLPSSEGAVTVEQGIFDQITIDKDGQSIVHSAKISGGCSGGPLTNSAGQVIGVNTWEYDGRYLAQTSNQLQQFLDGEGIKAEYVQVGAVPVEVILVIGIAVVLAVLIVCFMVKYRGGKPKIIIRGETRVLAAESGALMSYVPWTIKAGQRLTIGTDPSRCKIVFPPKTPGVSHVHCSVSFDGKTVRVKDEQSRYGTFIDGQKLASGGTEVLHRGHKLNLAGTKETFILK